jgi:hypothetical protein
LVLKIMHACSGHGGTACMHGLETTSMHGRAVLHGVQEGNKGPFDQSRGMLPNEFFIPKSRVTRRAKG